MSGDSGGSVRDRHVLDVTVDDVDVPEAAVLKLGAAGS
jgi:hypothetical protein